MKRCTREMYMFWGEAAKVIYDSLEHVPRDKGPSIKARESAARNIKRIVVALDELVGGGQ